MTVPIPPSTPVLVGVGQLSHKPGDLDDAVEALELMARACELAALDAGSTQLLSSASTIAAVKGAWKYSDPARLLADRFGASDARTVLSTDGGNTPQSLVNRLAMRIAEGATDVSIIVGAETIWSRRRARRAGMWIDMIEQTDIKPDEVAGADLDMVDPFEQSRGLSQPIHMYPLFESAVRYSNGETLNEHRDRLSRLWAGFNEVAVANPNAWFRTPMSADEIRNPSGSNRMIGFPYTKAMNSNWDLDQAAALILCPAETAEQLGVCRDRWVFPLAGTDGSDTQTVTNRGVLHESPAIRVAGGRCLEMAGVGPDEVGHIDLYSCFPSAVQIGAREIGFGLDRQLTVTGGLTFAGGPLNNYVTHSIATMAGVLRDDPGSVGFCSANGGFVTKHAFGAYSTDPPANGYWTENCQNDIDTHPTAIGAPDHVGPVEIEAYTVMFDADGPERALVACRVAPGVRTWANSNDPDLMAAMTETEFIGKTGSVDGEGVLTVN
ncbi:MAG: acetyl-CoA acetyltransferase [Actinomycetia bacterium]|nr:acetyl-CoA acetyltransferase [Actinomycetes bacterium]MCP4959185.1 acetyl-CoA acetyltransferase [Actinomycetes bacterium]